MANQSQFTIDLSKFVEKAKGNADFVIRKAAGEVLRSIVMKTPVGNPKNWKRKKAPPGYVGGRLRANWATTYGNPSFATTAKIDKTGEGTILKGQATIRRAAAGETIYILNSLPYAIPVEYGHSSKQAPAGMVRVTIAHWNGFVASAANEAAKK